MAPVLLVFIFTGAYDLFKCLLPLSYFTDMIDGYLARKFNIASTGGARLDSIADDVNVLVSITGLFVFKMDFIKQQQIPIIVLLSLYALQTVFALIRYGKISSFHTYLAKLAALLQGLFFIFIFFLPQPLQVLFYLTALVTSLELIEEIILVILLPQWQTDVKGIYWVLKSKPGQ